MEKELMYQALNVILCDGKTHSAEEVALAFGSLREQRKAVSMANADKDSGMIISSIDGITLCQTKAEKEKAVRYVFANAFTELRKAYAMLKKAELDEQVRIDLQQEQAEIWVEK